MKVSIIGVGNVGATLAYTLLMNEVIDDLVLVNRTRQRAEGEAADLVHSTAFLSKPMSIRAGDVADSQDSDIVIVTASARMESLDRLDLARTNVPLFRQLIPELAAASPQAVLLIVSNPVDILTYAAIRFSGFQANRVIGSGTLLDSARHRTLLAKHVRVHPDDLRAYILGEHGTHQFAANSNAFAGGVKIPMERIPPDLVEQAITSSHEIVQHKGYTNFAIAQAAAMIVRSIAWNQLRTMPVSTLIDNYYGVSDVCLSIPCVVGRKGVERRLYPTLDSTEQGCLIKCGNVVRQVLKEQGLVG